MLVQTKTSGLAKLRDVLQFYVDQGMGTYNEGIFVFPEMGLDGQFHSNLLLGEACGSVAEFNVDYFLDPLDPNTIKASKDIESFRSLFESQRPDEVDVSFKYNYLPTYTRQLEDVYLEALGGKRETVRRNLEGSARYLVCANELGSEKFTLMQKAIYSTYCDIDWETINSADARPLLNCNDSNHYDLFMTGEELDNAAEIAGVKNNLIFNECLYDAEDMFVEMFSLANEVAIDRTPKVLVNCQYEVSVGKEMGAVCQINSDLPMCG